MSSNPFFSFFVFSPGSRAALLLLLGASVPVGMADENQIDTVPLFVHTLVFGCFDLLLEKTHSEISILSPSLA